MSEIRGRSREDPMPEGWQPRGVTPRPRSGAGAKSAMLQWLRNDEISPRLLIFMYFHYGTLLSQENLKDGTDFQLTLFKFHKETKNRKISVCSDMLHS